MPKAANFSEKQEEGVKGLVFLVLLPSLSLGRFLLGMLAIGFLQIMEKAVLTFLEGSIPIEP
jgi:hypothetical protein